MMGTTASMNPHAVWAERGRQQALLNASACMAAYDDVQSKDHVVFDQVALIEHLGTVDVGVLRLEPQQMVFAGTTTTRVIPFGSVVLLGTQEVPGAPGRNACSVNSIDYLATMVFVGDTPLEYHVGAWYSRWLDQGFTSIGPPGTVTATTRPR